MTDEESPESGESAPLVILDEDEFNGFYEKAHRMVVSHLLKRSPSTAHHLIDDATQNTWLKAWEKGLPQWAYTDPDGAFFRHITRAAWCEMKNLIRHEVGHAHKAEYYFSHISHDVEFALDLESLRENPQKDEFDLVFKTMHEIATPKQKPVITAIIEGKSVREISEQRRTSMENTYKMWNTAVSATRSKLRGVLGLPDSAFEKRAPRSQYRGVHGRSSGWFEVGLKHNGKNVYGGIFRDQIQAARAYDRIAKECFGDKAKLNFPEVTTETAKDIVSALAETWSPKRNAA